ALYVGIPYAPISPAYALSGSDFSRLKHILGLLAPGLVFADDAENFRAAIDAAVPSSVGVVADAPMKRRETLAFADLLETTPTSRVDAAHAAINGDTIAKILFTSGSLAAPKAVVTTHRMLCANQTMLAHVLRFLAEEPPVFIDWLPWHHSFGGNHNFGMALQHGGTLYIDKGRPTAALIGETIAALREISPTVFFNVPQGFEILLPHLARDKNLAANFFRNLKLNFFAGASLNARVKNDLDALAIATCGERIRLISGFGATETAPSVLFRIDDDLGDAALPFVGLPLPGNALKLVPVGDKYEACVKGPNVTPGYWRDDALTRQAFDNEGYYRLGDSLRLAPDQTRGFLFEGRLGEDFKLASGTTVNGGPLRSRMLEEGGPFIKDVAIAGDNRDCLMALIFPDLGACRSLAADLSAAAPDTLLAHPRVQAEFRAILARLAAQAHGGAEYISRAALLVDAAGADELTDKGTLNRKAVLNRRAELVAALYRWADDPLFLSAEAPPMQRSVHLGAEKPSHPSPALGKEMPS
ncbi:MAG TPA: AMP-binding protein, partial [Methylovirgula sp.]|nr:AMP-binding protein [Methylovirgula sp.]